MAGVLSLFMFMFGIGMGVLDCIGWNWLGISMCENGWVRVGSVDSNISGWSGVGVCMVHCLCHVMV